MTLDLAQATVLFLAPFRRHLVEERGVHPANELVDVHCVDAIAEALVLRLKPLYRVLMFTLLVGMTGMERLTHPFQHLVVELEPTEHFGEPLLQHFLAHMLAAAGRGLSPALIGKAGAMIVNVFLLLDFADHRTAALGAGDQPGESEVVLHAPVLLGVSAAEHALNTFP